MKTLEQILSELQENTKISAWSHPLQKIFPEADRGQYLYTAQLLEKFDDAIKLHDSERIWQLCLISDADGIDKRFTGIFCNLLKENWHQSHEDVVMMLESIKDPKSVDCIYEMSLKIPSYDDGRALARKCIWALGAIDTLYAKEKLKNLALSDDEIIKETAIMQLKY